MLTKLLKTFDAPDFMKYYVIPVIVLCIVCYVIGLPFVIRDVKRGGYNQVVYNETCASKNREKCKDILDKQKFDECVANQNELHCDSRIEKTGKQMPKIAYMIIPPIVALILGGLLYKLLIFIKNPKVAAGYILFKGLQK